MVPDPKATEFVLSEARQYIEKVADRLAKQGVRATEQCVELGDRLAPTLLDLAKTRDIDLVALSTHGRGVTRLVVGSVADKLLRGSTLPLLVSRRPA
jgi:nucleotide-binding universal stress UspA family protein